MKRFMRTESVPGAAEASTAGAARRRTELNEGGGADGFTLLLVSLVLACKRPCRRTVSLRAKGDDQRHPMWTEPAFIAGEIVDLDVAINPGGEVRP